MIHLQYYTYFFKFQYSSINSNCGYAINSNSRLGQRLVAFSPLRTVYDQDSMLLASVVYFACLTTLQMFAGNYRDSTGKSQCRDFKFMGIAFIPAIPVTFKTHTLISIVIFEGNLILQGYYRDSPHQMQGKSCNNIIFGHTHVKFAGIPCKFQANNI